MSRKEFVRLLEENILVMDRMADRVRHQSSAFDIPRQQLIVLVRLHHGAPARLKDIARRENMSAPNLCAAFRKLERGGLVTRMVDDVDRRNTWYQCTPAGDKIARAAMEKFRDKLEGLFEGISAADEEKLTVALKTMAQVLKNMESVQNA
ncbi:MarR family transcriptional regulator [bacterium]|nr:MarR family transcriptional regulator [bacterium]